MLGRLVCFLCGVIIGFCFSPKEKPDQPVIKVVETCKEASVSITCPEVKCNDYQMKQNLYQWVKFSEQLTEKLSTCYEQREDLNITLKNQKDETEYYRKKYIDFTCSE